MEHKVFSVFDAKAKSFSPPVVLRTTGEGERWFMDLVADEKSTVYRYPDDFTMFELGSWDPQRGAIVMYEAPRSMGLAVHYKQSAIEANKSFAN